MLRESEFATTEMESESDGWAQQSLEPKDQLAQRRQSRSLTQSQSLEQRAAHVYVSREEVVRCDEAAGWNEGLFLEAM